MNFSAVGMVDSGGEREHCLLRSICRSISIKKYFSACFPCNGVKEVAMSLQRCELE